MIQNENGDQSMGVSIIESIFKYTMLRKRQLEAPLLRERELFLLHMLEQGTSRRAVRALATMLLHIVRLLDFNALRAIDLLEIEQASLRWMSDPGFYNGREPGNTSRGSFTYIAVRFFKFHNVMDQPVLLASPNDIVVEDFRRFLKVTQGMTTQTARSYGSHTRSFLNSVANTPEQLSMISLEDVDAYIQKKRDEARSPHTIVAYSMALRRFFQYAEARGMTLARIAGGIQNPRIARSDSAPKGPQWKDVRRLLNFELAIKTADLRAAAILSLCSIYGLRSTEVVHLTLSDFDWIGEICTVVRAKGGRVQQFPIQFEVGETILRYLQNGRPRCACRNLFVSLRPPYRPLRPSVIWGIVADRMKRLEIKSEHFGGHSLRHACATELLRKGSSLREIADFLGHRTMKSVSVYAKYDIRSLRKVAEFSLAGVR
jgi:integrase/recombinase XerD